MSKTKIVLVMHGNLGNDMVAAASRFIKDAYKFVTVISLKDNMSLNHLNDEFEKVIKDYENQVLVMTDILAGSCTVAITQMMHQYNFSLISGVNLSMLISAIENSSILELTELEKELESIGKEDIKLINRMVVGE